MKTTKDKNNYVKELRDADTSKEYDASKPLNLSQIIAASKRKRTNSRTAKVVSK